MNSGLRVFLSAAYELRQAVEFRDLSIRGQGESLRRYARRMMRVHALEWRKWVNAI